MSSRWVKYRDVNPLFNKYRLSVSTLCNARWRVLDQSWIFGALSSLVPSLSWWVGLVPSHTDMAQTYPRWQLIKGSLLVVIGTGLCGE